MKEVHIRAQGIGTPNWRPIMNRYLVALVAASCISALAGSAALAYTGQSLEARATIKMDRALAIASKARPGTVTDRELEREKGGSGLRYSFDIVSQGKTYEVGIDAMTGKVLENAPEGKNPD